MKKIEYEARVEVLLGRTLTDQQSSDLFEYLLDVEDLIDPVMGENRKEETLSVSYNIISPDPGTAITRGMRYLSKALGEEEESLCLAAMSAEPYKELAMKELVSQAEIARRLGVSREWVRRLANEGRFPGQAQKAGSRGGLYRWGDVLAWQEKRNRKAGRPKKDNSQELRAA